MPNKKILHVVNIYFVLPYFIGEQFLYLEEKGYDMHVVCSPSEHLNAYSKKMGFKYKEISILRTISIFQDLKSLLSICNYIKKNKIDIVVGHTPKGGLLAMLAAYVTRVPNRIYFRHGLVYETSSGIKRKVFILMEKLSAKCATKIVCVGPSVYEKSLFDNLNKEDKQIVIGRGTCGGIDSMLKFNPENIDIQKRDNVKNLLNLNSTDFVIGYCGRLVKDKGIIDLVTAFQQVSTKYNFKLLLVGDFEERDALPADIIIKIKSDPNIIITGFIFNDIEYYYSLMDVFILPSYREGFPMSVLEASSMKRPVLTTTVTGCIDSIIDGKTGFYVSNSSYGIMKGILRLREYSNLEEMGENGRKFVLEYFDNKILWPMIENELYSNKS